MSPRRRRANDEPVPVSEPLAELGSELGLAPPDAFAAIRERWSEIVGDEIGAHARARSLRSGVLRVTVDEAAWATQLRYLAGELLDRFDAIVGAGVVTQVRVTVGSREPGETR